MLNNKWCQWGRGQLLGKGAPGEDPLSSYQSVMKEPPSHIMKTRPRNLCVAAEENFEGKTSWREGVTVPICIPGILLSPCPQPWGYGWAQKGNFFSLFPLSWHFLNELLPNSEEEQNGMSIKNTNSVKIPRKYKFLILRAISPFVTGSWYGAHGPCWLSSVCPVLSVLALGLLSPSLFFLLGNKKWFTFRFRSCFLPGGMFSGSTDGERRSPLSWRNGLNLSQQASLCLLPLRTTSLRKSCLGAVGRLETGRSCQSQPSAPCKSVFVIF